MLPAVYTSLAGIQLVAEDRSSGPFSGPAEDIDKVRTPSLFLCAESDMVFKTQHRKARDDAPAPPARPAPA